MSEVGCGNTSNTDGAASSNAANENWRDRDKCCHCEQRWGSTCAACIRPSHACPVQVVLYFSAHWCPPCRAYTPILAECYKNGLDKHVEIIFCSSDRDQSGFNEYYSQMPWAAIPFADRETKACCLCHILPSRFPHFFGLVAGTTVEALRGEGDTVPFCT